MIVEAWGVVVVGGDNYFLLPSFYTTNYTSTSEYTRTKFGRPRRLGEVSRILTIKDKEEPSIKFILMILSNGQENSFVP